MTHPLREMDTQGLRRHVASELERTRLRTTTLTDAVADAELLYPHSSLMSPLVWDLVHIGNQEEQWLVRAVGHREPVRGDIDELYDAMRYPRSERPDLPLLGPSEARRYVAKVRHKALEVLDRVPLAGSRLTDTGFAFGMIIQHEQQHDETMLATHQLRDGPAVLEAPDPPDGKRTEQPADVYVPGGTFTMGTNSEPWALDNERPAHRVHVPPFLIDATPVTSGQYAEFIADGGYEDPRWWSEAGWKRRCEAELTMPAFWQRDGDGWMRRRFGVMEPVAAEEPVLHVCYYEAEAYASWAGKRLPSEQEWEKAARYDPATGHCRRYPWGAAEPSPQHANLGQRHLRPAPVGAYPKGASALGVQQMLGDVWEWTSSDFRGYPDFEAFPYAEYSEVFFGDSHKVLRGGSFGTDPAACRASFRNWDYPVRRQIFSGFRCARDPRAGEDR